MKKSLVLIIWIMLFACFCGAILVKPFILIAYGARFLPAVEIFWWILPGSFFLGIIVILSQYLAAIGFPRQLIGLWTLAFIVMLCSSLILIPRYDAQGAAMSLSLAYAVLFGLICLLAKKTNKEL
jgi:O-antigen/teichoic acid export membrane protein